MPLGKSLDNILVDYFGQTTVELKTNSSSNLVQNIPVESILPSPFQTRQNFEPEEIGKLAENIRQHGLISPILVIQKSSDSNQYTLVAGERRLRAIKLLGEKKILAIVKTETDLGEKKQAMLSAMENLQREDLTPIELAQTFEMLMKTQEIEEHKLAEILGHSIQYVKNYLRLLSLHESVKQALLQRKLGEGQARHLVGLPDNLQQKLLEVVIEKNLTVKEIEQLVKLDEIKEKKTKIVGIRHNLSGEILQKADRFASQFPNAKLKCIGDETKGKIVISWDNKKSS